MSEQEPILHVSPNAKAIELLSSLLDADATQGVPVWETTINLRITKGDLQGFLTGNRDLLQIGFWVTEESADGVAYPDGEPPVSLFG